MKKSLYSVFTLMTLFSISVYSGNGVERFEMDPHLARTMSTRAQSKLVRYVSEKCRPTLMNSKKINTRLVDLTSHKVDQGVVDYTYVVNVQFQQKNQESSEMAQITLTDYAGTNPTVDWVQIEKVETTNQLICE